LECLSFLQGCPIAYMGKTALRLKLFVLMAMRVSKPCTYCYNWQSKERSNVIGALYKKRLFALEYVYKNVSWEVMYDCCKGTLIPNLNTPCVIVIDNARFHKYKRIRLVNIEPDESLIEQAKKRMEISRNYYNVLFK
jgi:hypothetical protein